MPQNLAPDDYWRQLQTKLRVKAERSASGLDIDGIVGATMLRTVVRQQGGGIDNVEALAFKILNNEIASAMREKSRAVARWSPLDDETLMGKVLDSAPRGAGGRPKAEKYATLDDLGAALVSALTSEFRQVWGVDDRVAVADLIRESNTLDVKDRRAWLAFTLDHELGDRCPWAVDPTFSIRGAKRKVPARGVGEVPQPDTAHAARLLDLWTNIKGVPAALDHAKKAIADLATTVGAQAALDVFLAMLKEDAAWPTENFGSPIGDEFLTDREMAIISLLVGNFPESILERAGATGRFEKPIGWGVALTAEIQAMQAARMRHGVLRTPEEKRRAGVGPNPGNRKPPGPRQRR